MTQVTMLKISIEKQKTVNIKQKKTEKIEKKNFNV